MVLKPLLGRHLFLFCPGIVRIDLRKEFYDVPALLGEAFGDIDEVPPPMAQAVGQECRRTPSGCFWRGHRTSGSEDLNHDVSAQEDR